MKTLQSINNRLNLLIEDIRKWQVSDAQAPTAIERDVALVQMQHLYQELLDLETAAPSAFIETEPELEVEFVYGDESDDLDDEFDESAESAEDLESEVKDEVSSCNCSDSTVFANKNNEPQEEPLSALIDTIETEIEQDGEQLESNDNRCGCKDEESENEEPYTSATELMASVYNLQKSASNHDVSDIERCLIDGALDDSSENGAESKDQCQPCKEEDVVDVLGSKISESCKARFVDDLFTRDLTFFNNEIAKFEAMNSFDQTLIYIGEHYNWPADSDSAETFIAILENKFN